jgi:ADP-ribosylglycohydrolase
MLGAIIGDIVGSRFEFNNHRSTEFEFLSSYCSFTDDTICTVAVAEALINKTNFMDSLLWWCRRYPNPAGGYGMGFRNWLLSRYPEPYDSYGNGSAMRVSPVGWLGILKDVMEYARRSAEVTHNHPEGIKGAQCIADLIWRLRNGQKKEWLKCHVVQAYGYQLTYSCDQIRVMNSFNETCMITVPQAIQCFLESYDFESAVRLAVSIGGDSDTIAAITGSLAEAAYGIPEEIIASALKFLPQEMKEVITQFYKIVNNGKLQHV